MHAKDSRVTGLLAQKVGQTSSGGSVLTYIIYVGFKRNAAMLMCTAMFTRKADIR